MAYQQGIAARRRRVVIFTRNNTILYSLRLGIRDIKKFMNWREHTPEEFPAHIIGLVLSQGTILFGVLSGHASRSVLEFRILNFNVLTKPYISTYTRVIQ